MSKEAAGVSHVTLRQAEQKSVHTQMNPQQHKHALDFWIGDIIRSNWWRKHENQPSEARVE